jgi:NADH dehydrogenase
VQRFLFFSALGASTHHRTRFHRAKALAERAVREADLDSVIFAPSLIYAPGDPWLTLLSRLALLPVMPIPGRGRAVFQPIWADDVADCVMATLAGPQAAGAADGGGAQPRDGTRGHGSIRYELAGPETLSHEAIVRLALRSFGRPRPIVHVPTPIVSRTLRAVEAVAKERAFATWDEAELMEVSMTSRLGTADAERLGVAPKPMAAVLGLA